MSPLTPPQRNFRFISTLGFACTLMSTWEIALMYVLFFDGQLNDPDTHNRTSVFGLTNGGTAGLIWGYLIVWIGYMMVFATIAEMASM